MPRCAPASLISRARTRLSALLCGFCVLFAVDLAEARRSGLAAASCDSCHSGNDAEVEVSASPATFGPGDEVILSVSIRRPSAATAVGGFSVDPPANGELFTLEGEGTRLSPTGGITHSTPKAAVAGVVTLRFGWRAPSEPGGVAIDVAALAGDGDGRPSGDSGGHGRFLAAYGCTGVPLYGDLDGDGYGSETLSSPSIGCEGAAPPELFSPLSGDCNDNDERIHPEAPELCNRKDDDCDGELDENSELVEVWPDPDGDGYYDSDLRLSEPSMLGCAGNGYAAEPGDCDPENPEVNPAMAETCNDIDDNCDGRIDERSRPQCGEGACRRESFTCDPAVCYPGQPKQEVCNYFDDDCNGVIDDGQLCDAGNACVEGQCVPDAGGSSDSDAVSSAATTSGSPSVGSTTGSGAGGTATATATSHGSSGSPASSAESSEAGGCALGHQPPAFSWRSMLGVLLFALFWRGRGSRFHGGSSRRSRGERLGRNQRA